MKLAVISDIHGNLQALEAVLASIDDEGVDKVYCLGDIVGYGARPNECIGLIFLRQIPCILGNHDEAVNYWKKAVEINPTSNIGNKAQSLLDNH